MSFYLLWSFCAVLSVVLVSSKDNSFRLKPGESSFLQTQGQWQGRVSFAEGGLLAEFSINGTSGKDFYDLSAVDGFLLDGGMSVRSSESNAFISCNASRSVCPQENVNGSACINPDRNSGTTGYSKAVHASCPGVYTWSQDESATTGSVNSGGTFTITFCPAT